MIKKLFLSVVFAATFVSLFSFQLPFVSGLTTNAQNTVEVASDLEQKVEIISDYKALKPGIKVEAKALEEENIARVNLQTTPLKTELETDDENRNLPATLEINKLNLRTDLQPASISNLEDLDRKMLQSPVFENIFAGLLCSSKGNTYIMGHSEPAKQEDSGAPAAYVFNQLHTLQPGDIIKVTGFNGRTCKYRVFAFDKITTDNQNRVSREDFEKALNPNYNFPSLTIQTCELGSSTVRLLLRAELIQ